jgi:hypothetical protein
MKFGHRSLRPAARPPSPLVQACVHSTPAQKFCLCEPSIFCMPDSSCPLHLSVEVDVSHVASLQCATLGALDQPGELLL